MQPSWEKKFYRISLSLVLVLGATWALFVGGKPTSASPATVIHVNSTADILNPPAGVVTLRSAIQQANTTPGNNTINLTVPGTYKITLSGTSEDNNASGDFDILAGGDLTIVNTSGGAVVVDGNQLGRVFDLNPNPSSTAAPFTVTMQGFTIQGGLTSGDGGGIRAQVNACLVLDNMTVTGNASGGNGGGISAKGTKLIIHDSTVANNTAGGNGGGIEVETTGTGHDDSTIQNSTIALNKSGGNGGGINLGATFSGDLRLVSGTISGNSAVNGGGVFWTGGGHFLVQSTIIARNNLAQLFRATLSGAQEVPPTNSPGTGAASILLSPDQTTITVNGNFSNLQGIPTAFHLHVAPAGQNSPNGVAKDANGNPLNLANVPAATSGTVPTQNFTVNNDPPQSFVTQLQAGNVYVNLHSNAIANNGGEIRGQFAAVPGIGPDIVTTQRFTATLSGGQEVPPTNSPATGSASILLSADQKTATFNESWSGLQANATVVHVHNAPTGANGPGVFNASGVPATTSGSIPQQSFALTSDQVAQLQMGNIYTNLHSTAIANNGGEIRGQFSVVPGALTDLGYNLIGVAGDGSGNTGFDNHTTQTGTVAKPLDPLLGPLQNNGGPTQTMALLCGSPAIDKGRSDFSPTDQRGLPRTFDDPAVANAPGGHGTDIGAFEVQRGGCNRPPIAKCKNITVPANNSCQASITAADVNDGSSDPDGDRITLSLDHTGPFSLGAHQVTLTVTDSHGASSSCTSTVTVVATTTPTIDCQAIPAQTAMADASCSAKVPDLLELVRAHSSNSCGAKSALVITQTPAAGTTVGLGPHPITVKVADAASPTNFAQCVVNFAVLDKTPPTISGASANPATLWPANHELVDVTVNYTTADNCSPSSGTTNKLSVTSNEPVKGRGSDDKSPDWVIVDDHHVQLRAERLSRNRARVYTIKLTSTDKAGNSSFKTVTVKVEPPPSSGALPRPWVDQDVGEAKDIKHPGSASYADGVFTVKGNGWDIFGTDDSFHFVSQSLNGDGQIVARVLSVEDTFQWAKAGVMIRENLTPDSRNTFMAVTPGAGTTFQGRLNPGSGGVVTEETLGGHHSAPYWVKLVRNGNTFTGYQSSDGVNWVQVGSYTVNMPNTVYIGLAVTSTNKEVLCTATFDNVVVKRASLDNKVEQVLQRD